jgi:hypothetical protein
MSNRFLAFERELDLDQSMPVVAELPDLANEIDQRNHWLEEGEIDEQKMQLLMQVAARGLHELFYYCFAGRSLDKPSEMRMAVRRFIAVAWLIQPGLLKSRNGRMMTLDDLAALPSIDCSKCALSLKAQAFGKRWDFHARIQKRKVSKVNYAAAAKVGWAKRREKQKKTNGHAHTVQV